MLRTTRNIVPAYADDLIPGQRFTELQYYRTTTHFP